jgi:hypothetical protein
MAAAKFGGVTGNLSIGGVGGDLTSFDLEARQQVDDVTGYQESSDADHSGSGVRAWALDFTGFLMANGAGTSPGLGSLSNAVAAVVATCHTSCTYSGNFVIESLRISHKKIAGGIPFSGRAHNKGAVVEAWATS